MSSHQHHDHINESVVARMAWGKTLRKKTPRSAHAYWQAPAHRLDPIAMLQENDKGRLDALIPIRHGRMVPSPFTFYRGSAAAMAADLAHTPVTGINVQLCGDCHLLNFGIFATPERNLVFDVNDFDETLPGPWEWDVKRLATSFILAGRFNHLNDRACKEAAQHVVFSYRAHMREYAHMGVLEVWYAHLDSNLLVKLARSKAERDARRAENVKARSDNTARIFPKMTAGDGHERRIVDRPPRIFHLSDDDPLRAEMYAALKSYPDSLQDHRCFQLSRFKVVDLAMKVVGVGSVGTRCGVFLLLAGQDDPLFLQIKEARPSVLEPFVARAKHQNQGHRVVAGQRLMQATSDIFIGWAGAHDGHHYYFRQLRDSKGGVEVEGMVASHLIDYADACGWALARAHAKSGDAAAITGYLGNGATFDRAVAAFAVAYADQTVHDHDAMKKAVKSGKLIAQMEDDKAPKD